jgi:hypothetical protein
MQDSNYRQSFKFQKDYFHFKLYNLLSIKKITLKEFKTKHSRLKRFAEIGIQVENVKND